MRLPIFLLFLLLATLLPACGGSGGGGDGASTGEGTVGGQLQVSSLAILEIEPNQSLADAQQVQPGSRISGEAAENDAWFAVANDQTLDAADLFRMTVNEPLRATLIIAENDLAVNDLDLLLLDASGNLLDISEGLVSSEFIDITSPGTYLVGVRGFKGSSRYLLAFDAQIIGSDTASIGSRFVAGELLVSYAQSTGSKTLALSTATTAVPNDTVGIFRWEIPRLVTATISAQAAQGKLKHDPGRVAETSRRASTLQMLARLSADSAVKYVEPNYLRQPLQLPDDSNYPLQWHYPLIKLPQAWEITTGDPQQVIAVIDTGVAPHPDLSARLTETGYDFISLASISNDGDGIDPDPTDPGDDPRGESSTFHGTHVAGTIGARTDNGIGVAGVTWQGGIMPLRAVGVGGGSDYDIAQAIRYAAGLSNDSGIVLPTADRARIINLSLGDPAYSITVANAVAAARAAGAIVVAAAGNNGSTVPMYPAALPGVFSVGAIDLSLQKAPYSNFGSSIDLVAPGGNLEVDINGDGYGDGVLSTGSDDNGQPGYIFYQGTSMATPHAAGVFSLMLAANPELTELDLQQLVAGTHPAVATPITQDLGEPGRDNVFGYGLIDAALAVRAALAVADVGQSDLPLLNVNPTFLDFGTRTRSLQVQLGNAGGGSIALTGATSDVPWLAVDKTAGALPLNLNLQVDRSGLATGDYSGTLTVRTDAAAPVTIHVTMSVVAVGQGDVGTIFVLLIDAGTEESIATVATEAKASYRYSIQAPPGEYYLAAGTDLDDDDFICDSEDACGIYPSLVRVESADQVLSGFDFDVHYLLQPLATGLRTGGQGFRLPGVVTKVKSGGNEQ